MQLSEQIMMRFIRNNLLHFFSFIPNRSHWLHHHCKIGQRFAVELERFPLHAIRADSIAVRVNVRTVSIWRSTRRVPPRTRIWYSNNTWPLTHPWSVWAQLPAAPSLSLSCVLNFAPLCEANESPASNAPGRPPFVDVEPTFRTYWLYSQST